MTCFRGKFCDAISPELEEPSYLNFALRMAIMTHDKFHFNRLMLILIFGILASEPPPPPPRAWRTTEKAGLDRVKGEFRSQYKLGSNKRA